MHQIFVPRLAVSQVDNALYDAFGQRQVSTIYKDKNQYHVVMEVAPQFWQSPDMLRDIYVSTAGIANGTQPTADADRPWKNAFAAILPQDAQGSCKQLCSFRGHMRIGMRIPSKEPDKQGEGDLREQPERRSEGDGVPFCLHRDASGVCSYPANGRELLEKAAELFVASMARPEGGASKEIASWLEEAPCHNCAWCKISGVWQALEKDISPGKAGFPG